MIIENKTSKILSELKPMTPLNVYMAQVQNCMDSIRAANIGQSYIPSQFGGTSGQRALLQDVAVLQIVSFDI